MPFKIFRQNDQGFTLIEVLVSILIMGILTAIAAPSFMTWVYNKKVDGLVADVEGALKEAQSTAIRKSITCNVLVTETTVTSVKSATDSTEVPACLPSGSRQLPKLQDGSNDTLKIAGTGGSTGTIFTFSSRGTANITPSTEAVVIYRTDAAGNGKNKCLVVSSGIGIMKSGTYSGTLPPVLSTPPSAAETTAVVGSCIIPS